MEVEPDGSDGSTCDLVESAGAAVVDGCGDTGCEDVLDKGESISAVIEGSIQESFCDVNDGAIEESEKLSILD